MARIIGVVGDPNTGKSVLSHLIYRTLAESGIRTMFQDAELYSPTPPWYLESLREELRNRLKEMSRQNVEKKLEWIVRSLEGLRKNNNIDIVIVDIGGGKPPIRVTAENEKILRNVDGVIVLCRRDDFKSCVMGWVNQIKSRAPNVDIVAICESALEGEPRVDFETGTCVLTGLTRENAPSPPLPLKDAVNRLTMRIVMFVYDEEKMRNRDNS